MSAKELARTPAKLNEKIKAKENLAPEPAGQDSAVEAEYDGPKPTHFLARPEGNFTPLIPLDELPDSIKLTGLPLYVNEEHLLKNRAQACFPIAEKHANPYQISVEDNMSSEDEDASMSDDDSVNIPSSSAINVSR